MTVSTVNAETIAAELLTAYGIQTPPVPIEAILQHPMPDMWETVDLSDLSGTFYVIGDPYMPRLALARLLVRMLADSEWGTHHGLTGAVRSTDRVNHMARAILAPRPWLAKLPAAALKPIAISALYQIPLSEAIERLQELDISVG